MRSFEVLRPILIISIPLKFCQILYVEILILKNLKLFTHSLW